jgi:hypothetical protein
MPGQQLETVYVPRSSRLYVILFLSLLLGKSFVLFLRYVRF